MGSTKDRMIRLYAPDIIALEDSIVETNKARREAHRATVIPVRVFLEARAEEAMQELIEMGPMTEALAREIWDLVEHLGGEYGSD
jgi:hypothetical protein